MSNELQTHSKEFKEFKTSLQFFSEKVDETKDVMKQMREEMKSMTAEITNLREDNWKLRDTVDDLEIRLRGMEQYSRIANIEISGVPQTANENLDLVLSDIAKAINVELQLQLVEAAHRVPSYNEKHAPSIIVRFLSRRDKQVWIDGFKTTRPLTADKINPRLPKEKVFINEHLSPANKMLLSRTKEAAKNRGYKFIWTKDGKIFIRRNEGEKIVKVVSENRDDNQNNRVDNFHNHPTTNKKQNPPTSSRLAPRFQKLKQNDDSATSSVSPVDALSKNYEETLFIDLTTESDITSPYGPSQLIAAGRRKQQERALEEIQHDSLMANSFQTNVNKVPNPDEDHLSNNVPLLYNYLINAGYDHPVYSSYHRKADNRKKLYGGLVKINKDGNTVKTVSSFPFEHPVEELALGCAAKNALEILCQEEKVKLQPTIITASCDKSVLYSRVSEIVARYPSGLFAQFVEQTYVEKYNECLPEDWIPTMRSCPTISVEPNLSSYIIVPKDPNLQIMAPPSPSPTPQVMEFPPDDSWSVYVTSVVNSSIVNLLIVGENYDLYTEQSTNMCMYYNAMVSNELALNIEKGKFYAAEVASDSWHRVFICEVDDSSKTVTAWLIDHGDSEKIPFSSLYRLPAQFCNLPIQCIQCELDGLERFADDPVACEIVTNSDLLIGKTLVATVMEKDSERGSIKATLFDTSGSDDINVNGKLLEAIIYERSEPQLPNEGHATEVFVVSMSKRGEVFIQIPNTSCQELFDALAALSTDEINKHKLTSYRQMTLDRIYLAKYSGDNNWYRAMITTTPSFQQDRIAVRFIDFGNEETVSMSDMASVENLPSIIERLPHQALRVALHNLPLDSFTPAEIAKLKSLLLDDQKVILVKTIKIQEDPPLVEIFYKNENDNYALVSVNNSFDLLFRQRNEINSHPCLDIVKLPPDLQVGKFVPVQILLAANPSNFWFRHLMHIKDLDVLMTQMAYAYENTTCDLTNEDIVKGELYAAQYDDEKWYRVLITDKVSGSNVPVRLVDFGDMNWVELSRIRKLEPMYRKLPFMAIRGKLAGVAPIHQDWSVYDCMTFQKLTEIKLAAVIRKIEHIEPMETVVFLSLFNTSSGDDINIAQTLVDDERARVIGEL